MNSKNDQLIESFDPVYSVYRTLKEKLGREKIVELGREKICKKILEI